MQAYTEYKDSSVDWLGEIPAGWEVRKLKHLGNAVIGLTYDPKNLCDAKDGILVLRSSNLKGGRFVYGEKENIFVKMQISTKLKIRSNDILICSRNGSRDLIGKCALATSVDAGVSFGAFTTVFRSELNGYIFHILNSDIFKQLSGSFLTSTINQLTVSNLNSIQIALPPLSEQTAIAGFLDDKTAKIEALVGIKRRQIELLVERKQILVQNAVTKGLNPAAPMKDSGVDWIGPIPTHWEVKPAKHLFFEVDERSESGDEELLSVSHMTGVTPRSEKTVSMFLAEDYSGSKICVEGDLVFNIMWAWMGALGVSAQLGIVSPSYAVFRQLKSQTFNPIYLEMLMQSLGYIEHYNKVSTGLHSSRLRFYSHMFLSMKIGFPSFEEQERIVQFLTKETGKISKAISVLEKQTTKLNEYKTTLINAAVTGKIKVA